MELDLIKEVRMDIIKLEKQMDNKLLEIFYKLNKYIKDNEVKKE
jgi:hypothetical protein